MNRIMSNKRRPLKPSHKLIVYYDSTEFKFYRLNRSRKPQVDLIDLRILQLLATTQR